MREAPAERWSATKILQDEGWTVVTIPKPRPSQEQLFLRDVVTMSTWCENTIGAGRIEPGANWLDGHDVWYMFAWYGYWSFHFKYEKDAVLFTLRWK